MYGANHERGAGNVLSGGAEALKGTTGRRDLGNFIGWESPWRDPFRDLLVHPRIVGILNEILGRGFRLDHGKPIERIATALPRTPSLLSLHAIFAMEQGSGSS